MSKRSIDALLTSLPGTKKRKDNEITDYDDDDIEKYLGHVSGPLDNKFGQRRAFPININIEDVKLNVIPSTVEEYLAQVRLEALNDDMGNGISNDYDDGDMDKVYYKPRKSQMNDIPEEISKYIREFQLKRNEYREFRMQLEELDAIELPNTAKEWKTFIWEISCEREYVAQIVEENLHIKLLVYCTKWLGVNLEENLYVWTIALLASLEDVIGSSECSVLRQLGKKALKQIPLSNEENVHYFENIVSIIGVLYGQKDLLDELDTVYLPPS